MDMAEVLFAVLWVLPGTVVGIMLTLAMQAVARSCSGASKVKDDDQTPCNAKESDIPISAKNDSSKSRVMSINRNRSTSVQDDDCDHIGYISSTKRVHSSKTCSGMLKAEPIQLCSRCFKH